MNNACGGDFPDPPNSPPNLHGPQEFKRAAFEQGLSGYFGWDNSVGRLEANRAAKYILDRLAGENANVDPGLVKENPLQRPFSGPLIMTDMANQQPTRFDYSKLPENGVDVIAYLQFTTNPREAASVAQLAPSIEHLEVKATRSNQTELQIRGFFGSVQGTVTVGGSPVTVIDGGWQPNLIRCTLLAHDQAGGHGDVIVDIGGHHSNPVPLTLWELTFTDTLKRVWSGSYVFLQPMPPDFATWTAMPTGNLTVTTTLKLYIRGDAHQFRSVPGQKEPFNNPARSIVISTQGRGTKDAEVTSVTVTGSASETVTNDKNSNILIFNNNYSVEGAASIGLDGSDSRAQIGSITGQIDPTNNKLGVLFDILFDPLVHIDSTSVPPGAGSDPMTPTGHGISFPGSYVTGPFQLDLDNNYNVIADSRFSTNTGRGYTDSLSVSWTCQVLDAPRSDTGRSVNRQSARR